MKSQGALALCMAMMICGCGLGSQGSPDSPHPLEGPSDDDYFWCGDDDCSVDADGSSFYQFTSTRPVSVRIIFSPDLYSAHGTLVSDIKDIEADCSAAKSCVGSGSSGQTTSTGFKIKPPKSCDEYKKQTWYLRIDADPNNTQAVEFKLSIGADADRVMPTWKALCK